MNLGGQPRVPVFSQVVQPSAPLAGDLWFKTDTKVLYQYDGAAFNQVVNLNLKLVQHSTMAGSATSVTINVDTTYPMYLIIGRAYSAGADPSISLRFNADAGTNYSWVRIRSGTASVITGENAFFLGGNAQNKNCAFHYFFSQVRAQGNVCLIGNSIGGSGTGSTEMQEAGQYAAAADITSVTIVDKGGTAGNLTGEVYVYGVSGS